MSRKPLESYPKTSSIKSVCLYSKESQMKNANGNSSKPSTLSLLSKASKIFSKTSSTPKKSPNNKSKKSSIRPIKNSELHSLRSWSLMHFCYLVFIIFSENLASAKNESFQNKEMLFSPQFRPFSTNAYKNHSFFLIGKWFYFSNNKIAD